MTDFDLRRTTMVDTQVRPSDVTKFPIIEAMLSVPREMFVPGDRREAAYAGENIALGEGRVVLDPRTLAKMLDAADIQPGEMVLDIGPGLGYSSALAARLCEAVIALEENADFATEAERILGEVAADNVAVVEGPLAEGAKKHGPYDVILIQGAVEEIPQALLDQLKDNGRIVAIFAEGALGVVRVGLKTQDRVTWRFAFNGAAPLLTGFAAAKEFAL